MISEVDMSAFDDLPLRSEIMNFLVASWKSQGLPLRDRWTRLERLKSPDGRTAICQVFAINPGHMQHLAGTALIVNRVLDEATLMVTHLSEPEAMRLISDVSVFLGAGRVSIRHGDEVAA